MIEKNKYCGDTCKATVNHAAKRQKKINKIIENYKIQNNSSKCPKDLFIPEFGFVLWNGDLARGSTKYLKTILTILFVLSPNLYAHSEADEILKNLVTLIKDSETWIEETDEFKRAKKYVDQINRVGECLRGCTGNISEITISNERRCGRLGKAIRE